VQYSSRKMILWVLQWLLECLAKCV